MKYKVVVVSQDDDSLRLLNQALTLGGFSLIAEVVSLADEAELFSYAGSNEVDLLIVDLEQCAGGVGVAKQALAHAPATQVIYISSNPELAPATYQTNVIKFLLKPTKPTDAADALRKGLRTLELQRLNKPFAIVTRTTTVVIPTRSIEYVSSDRRVTTIHADSGAYTQYATLDDIEHTLPHLFLRCRKSCLINLARMCEHTTESLTISNDKVVSISQKRQAYARAFITSYLNGYHGLGL